VNNPPDWKESHRSERLDRDLVIDFNRRRTPIGIEITTLPNCPWRPRPDTAVFGGSGSCRP
jgi:hypothetical protein